MSFAAGFDPSVDWQPHNLVVVVEGRILADVAAARTVLRWGQLASAMPVVLTSHHLGGWCGEPVFVVDLAVSSNFHPELELLSLRSLLDRVTPAEFDLLGRALQIVNWRQTHRFCGSCATPTALSDQELCLHCPRCKAQFYPRIAPCVIGLVNRGQNLLLAHHQRHKEPRYSLLAGFIEAGESAEQALAREIMEEVGVSITNIQYVTSQSWPFPGQLMLGFFAEYAAGELQPDRREILDVQWFALDALPLLPPPQTIAGKLIAQRLEQLRAAALPDLS